MKTKKLKALIVTIMLGIVFSCKPVCATEYNMDIRNEESSPWYVNISSASADLSISGSTATCSAILKSKKSNNLEIEMKLQKYLEGNWSTVATWSTSNNNGTRLNLTKTKGISRGTYRVRGVFTCGNETVTINSSSEKY